MSKRTIRTAAMCIGCGSSSVFDITFDLIETKTSQELITYPDFAVNPLVVYCENCNRRMINVDPLIADSLAKLNHMGYGTDYSCEGHWRKKAGIVRDPETHSPTFKVGYELMMPCVLFDRELIFSKVKTIYETCLEINEDHPEWKVVPKLQTVRANEQTHKSEVHTIVPKALDTSTWKALRAIRGIHLWVGAKRPTELDRYNSTDDMDYDVGYGLALEMTQDFNQFLRELVIRLQ